MHKPKVSIIIPVYNISSYIGRAINSCLHQSYQEIEIIVVDDGSTDSTYDIIQKLKVKDNRVSVIRKMNGGVSSARNVGIANAQGDYLVFLDGDDWLENNAIEILISYIIENPNYLIISEVWIARENDGQITRINRNKWNESLKVNRKDALLSTGTAKYKTYNLHGNIYSKSIIDSNGIRFDESISHGEDGLFNFIYLMNSSGCFCLNITPVWNVFVRKGSAIRSGYNPKKKTALNAALKMIELSDDIEIQYALEDYYLARLYDLIKEAILDDYNMSEVKELHNKIKECRKHIKNAIRKPDIYMLYYSLNIMPTALAIKLIKLIYTTIKK